MKPVFILSLDLEMIWGYINTPNLAVRRHLKEVGGIKLRRYIDLLLNILEKYRIQATWAVVGHLFLDHCMRKDGIIHGNMPRPRRDWYIRDPGTNVSEDPLFYGKDIIEKILSSPIEHEIGYHSFSHVIFSKCNKEVAEAEINEGIKLAKELNIKLKSFVFPQNKVGHLDLLKKYGFTAFSGKPLTKHKIKQNALFPRFIKQIERWTTPPVKPRYVNGLWEIPSNMFFYDRQNPWSVLPRAKVGLERAVISGRVFHISLHPWNLSISKSLKDNLDKFLAYLSKKRDEGRVDIMTMKDLSEELGHEQNLLKHRNRQALDE